MAPLPEQVQQLQQYFSKGNTFDYSFRRQQLQNLKNALLRFEEELYAALYTDLKKNREESWITEVGFVIGEINHALKNLKKWMKPRRTGTNLLNFPSKSYILAEPLGVVLIIGPWNYPLQLLLNPLVGAIAAGNCAVVKPSELAPATSAVLKKLVQETFAADYVLLVEGTGAEVIPHLMNSYRFDHVFFTGSIPVGRAIYELAAQQLIPVTLELGGKSPCIVEPDAHLRTAARRIALTKFSNAGQMCVAPDYLLVHESIADKLLLELKSAIESFYNAEAVRSYHYGKIVNEKQFNRLLQYMQEGTVVYGGKYDEATLFVEPTLLADVSMEGRVMQEEIFGPLLPVLTWKEEADAVKIIQQNKNPLAFYIFTNSKAKAEKWTRGIAFGGGCINNASWHLTNHDLPFGGRGHSGFGTYHGRFSFETFSHKKGIMKTPVWFDPDLKYPPFKGKLNLFKKLIR